MSVKGKSPSSGVALLKNAAAAPFVYFDGVPLYGTLGGNLEIELGSCMLMPKADGNVTREMVCAAHLRCSPQAAVQLVDALTKALQMHQKQMEAPSELLKEAPTQSLNS